jgi:sulfofructose kinase
MAANAAIAVTRLGGRADFWGRVGDDLNAPLLAAALEADGVNTAGLRRMAGGRSPVSAVLVDRHGERTIIGFRGADLGIDPGWLPLETLIGAGALCCDPRWPEGVAWMARKAKRAFWWIWCRAWITRFSPSPACRISRLVARRKKGCAVPWPQAL